MDETVLKQEKAHLTATIAKVSDAKNELEHRLTVLGQENLDRLANMRNDPATDPADRMQFEQQLVEKNASFNVKDKLKMLEEFAYAEKEPYFARLDLTDNPILYIGKFGYTEDKPVITDWRSKIASIYYRYRYPQKNVKYTTPEGEKTVDLLLKRTFEVDNGELLKYYNNDIQFDEGEIIADKLQKRTGGVLEDIVETIQEGQLDIIEADPRQICIVQGCVGSGKSTVAIHKLSHIMFNYPELIQPERAILIAKSHILVSYLSTLFPKLGIFDINYKTLSELLTNVIFRENLKISFDLDDESDLSDFTLARVKKLQADLAKVQKQYAKKIEDILAVKNYEAYDTFVYDPKISLIENITEFIEELDEELVFQKERFKANPTSVHSVKYKINIDNIRSLTKKLQKLRAELKDKAFKGTYRAWGIDDKRKLNYKETLVYLYIHTELFGLSKKVLKYQYCVVDEGQDLSPLEYLMLGKFVLNGRFCILGDLNQTYNEAGLTKWEEIQDVITEARNAQTFELDTNYRSTKQIIEFANTILRPHTTDYLPKSIDRHGPTPEVLNLPEINDMLTNFTTKLEADLKVLEKSIGIIVFGEELFAQATAKLESLKHKIPAKDFIKLDGKSRISYLPKGVYLTQAKDCKGLEFSKVYVLGTQLDSITNFSDAKRTFVAVTRAMNELIVYNTK